MKRNRHGFTLAELLIVVAIIGVLVAISIPIFSNKLEAARDAVTATNLRNAYSEAAMAYINEEGTGNAVYIPAGYKGWTDPRVLVFGVEVKGLKDGFDGTYDWPFQFEDIKDKNGETGESKIKFGLGNKDYKLDPGKYAVIQFQWDKTYGCLVSCNDRYGDDKVKNGNHIHKTGDYNPNDFK